MHILFIAYGLVVAILGGLIAVELWWPARKFEEVAGWRLKCLAFIPMILLISNGVPAILAGPLQGLALLPGHHLGTWGGAAVGIVLSELMVYWVHRWHHSINLLWLWVHQLHHSAERMDVFGAAYFHPFEILEGSLVGVFFFSVLLGLSPEAAGLSVLWQAFAGVFQHGNIRTPRWLGYFIQRPEQHCVHHQKGLHAFNYANLPIWDMLFGTFRNPTDWEGEAGFYSGASRRLGEMLVGRDVSVAPEEWVAPQE